MRESPAAAPCQRDDLDASDADSAAGRGAPTEDPRLVPWRKGVFGLGDLTINAVLVSVSMVYVSFFLVTVVGLRPGLAAAVQLVGRAVDAFTDPAMGRLSDRCRWKSGRRRPFFLLGAVPFGAAFGLLWWTLPTESQWGMFAYYTSIYVLLSVSMTVLSVPYLALQPEMAMGYDARTSLNAWRNAGSVLGIFLAIAIRPMATFLGGGPEGYAAAGALYGLVIAVPWVAIYFVTWERPEFQQRGEQPPFLDAVRRASRLPSFRRLVGMYLCGRVSMDLMSAMLILYVSIYVGRTEDFELLMGLFFSVVLISLPFWMRLAPRVEKATVFIFGSLWWATSLFFILMIDPGWPRWLLLVIAPAGAVGYAVMDLMPWSMLGEVVDEDDLDTGSRQEGIYYGLFTFLRKLAGTIAVSVALGILDLLGYAKDAPVTDSIRTAILLLTSMAPGGFLLFSAWLARGYPLTRQRHAEILEALSAREASRAERLE